MLPAATISDLWSSLRALCFRLKDVSFKLQINTITTHLQLCYEATKAEKMSIN